MNPSILYEDKDILAINKPAGLVVHSDGRSTSLTTSKTTEPTLVDWLIKKYPETRPVRDREGSQREFISNGIKDVGELGRNSEGEEILRSGIVHRLDRETSGVMLIAKTQKAFDILKKQFQNREVKKIYHAFVWGSVKADEGTVDRPIGRSSKDFRMWSAQRGARGEMREAVTEYKVLKRLDDYSFVEISPKTGRTHQIRVHFKAINYPLVADKLYAPKKENTLGFKRLALHSYQITFKDVAGESRTVVAPYPEDFANAVGVLQSHR